MTTTTDKLAEALELALRSHGVMLLADPPQDAWKARQVEHIAREALAAHKAAAPHREGEPATKLIACIQHAGPNDKGRLFFIEDVSPRPWEDGWVDEISWTLLYGRPLQASSVVPAEPAGSASIEVQQFAIEVEKLLCAKLGRKWSAVGISIASLIDELAAVQGSVLPDSEEPAVVPAEPVAIEHLRHAWATLHNLSVDMEPSPMRQQMQKRAQAIREYLDSAERDTMLPDSKERKPLDEEQIESLIANWASSRVAATHGNGEPYMQITFTLARLKNMLKQVRVSTLTS